MSCFADSLTRRCFDFFEFVRRQSHQLNFGDVTNFYRGITIQIRIHNYVNTCSIHTTFLVPNGQGKHAATKDISKHHNFIYYVIENTYYESWKTWITHNSKLRSWDDALNHVCWSHATAALTGICYLLLGWHRWHVGTWQIVVFWSRSYMNYRQSAKTLPSSRNFPVR